MNHVFPSPVLRHLLTSLQPIVQARLPLMVNLRLPLLPSSMQSRSLRKGGVGKWVTFLTIITTSMITTMIAITIITMTTIITIIAIILVVSRGTLCRKPEARSGNSQYSRVSMSCPFLHCLPTTCNLGGGARCLIKALTRKAYLNPSSESYTLHPQP